MGLFQINNISYSYDSKRDVIKDLSYIFDDGKVYSIVGKSGTGKTTLLSLLSGLTKPKKGTITYKGKDITRIDQYTYRSRYIGVIFQSFNLLPHLTAMENVIPSMDISGKKIKDKKEKALKLLKDVGLSEEHANRKILKLSGGEQQRVAIARTLAYEPDVILADEPTGNLDSETQKNIINIFKTLAREQGKCVIIVTHSPEVASMSDEVYDLAAHVNGKAV